MKIRMILPIAVVLLTLASVDFAQSRCRQIADPTQRRACLEREAAEANRQANIANKNLAFWNNAMRRTCQTYQVLDTAAGLAAKQGQTVNIRAAGKTWVTVRALLSAATQERQKCESARQEVERARRP